MKTSTQCLGTNKYVIALEPERSEHGLAVTDLPSNAIWVFSGWEGFADRVYIFKDLIPFFAFPLDLP